MTDDISVQTSPSANRQESVYTPVRVSNSEHLFTNGEDSENATGKSQINVEDNKSVDDFAESQIFYLPRNRVFSTLAALFAGLSPVLIMLIFIGFFHNAFAGTSSLAHAQYTN